MNTTKEEEEEDSAKHATSERLTYTQLLLLLQLTPHATQMRGEKRGGIILLSFFI